MNIEKSRFLAGQVSRWESYKKGEVRRKQGRRKGDKSTLPVKSLKHMVPGRHPGDSSVEWAI